MRCSLLTGGWRELEFFDAPATFAKMLEKILTSYAVDALEEKKEIAPPAEPTVREFIERLETAAARNYPAIGEGEDVRLFGSRLAGGALAAGERAVHLAAFPIPDAANA